MRTRRSTCVGVLLAAACAAAMFSGLVPTARAGALGWVGPSAVDRASGPTWKAVACPSSAQCTAADGQGQIITFDPGPGATPPAALVIDPGQSLSGIACPSTTQCTGVDARGGIVTFNPQSPGQPARIQATGGVGWTAVACPTSTQCTAVGVGLVHLVATFNPQAPGAVGAAPLPQGAVFGTSLVAIACVSTSRCVATDTGSQLVGFDPADPAGATVTTIGPGFLAATISCPTSNYCVSADLTGDELPFSPDTLTAGTSHQVSNIGLEAISCVAANECTAVDSDGRELTFDPTVGGAPARNTIAPGRGLTAVACPSVSRCAAVGADGVGVTFSQGDPAQAKLTTLAPGPILSAVSCPAATQCTAVDRAGQEVTFNPAAPGGAQTATLDAQLADPVLDYLGAVSCPSTHQCTAVEAGEGGKEITFDPTLPAGASSSAIDANHIMSGVACPLATRCVAVDGDGRLISFDPGSPGAASTTTLPNNPPLTAITCPSATQCTAIDFYGKVATFAPATPGSPTLTATFSSGGGVTGLACPTTTQCEAVALNGEVVTFNPAAPVASQPAFVDGGHNLVSVACPSTTVCVAVDDFGRAVEGNPLDVGGWAPGRTLIGSGGLYGVACPLVTRCVAVDGLGNVFAGTGDGQPPYPYILRPPAITGTALEGQWLSVRRGTWSPDAVAYRYQWERCPSTTLCSPIPSASGTRYHLTSNDMGERLRVIEVASSAVGAGTPATSAATGVVSALGYVLIDSAQTHGNVVGVRIECLGRAPTQCPIALSVTVVERTRGGKIVAVGARSHRVTTKRRVVTVGSGSETLSGGQKATVALTLGAAGRRLLSARRRFSATVSASINGKRQDSTTVTFVIPRRRR